MAEIKTVTATDLEDLESVEVIEILVEPGQQVEAEQSIVTLESEKAVMEFPSPYAGVIKELSVKLGDQIQDGASLFSIEVDQPNDESKAQKPVENAASETVTPEKSVEKEASPENSDQENSDPEKFNQQKLDPKQSNTEAPEATTNDPSSTYASPMVKKYARELGVSLETVAGSGEHGRVKKEDVQQYVSANLNGSARGTKLHKSAPVDFSVYGEIETEPLNKLRQVSAAHLHEAWTTAPHVTQFDEANIEQLNRARLELKDHLAEQGFKLTLLPFIMKAVVKALQAFPRFNSSLSEGVDELILKKYFHIGIAVDTPRGLLVPVIRDVDHKKIPELAQELMQMSERAREGKLGPKEMKGGCFSLTNIGGIGGQHFTPIINHPEVAILGLSRTMNKLAMVEGNTVEQPMLPLSLSYDHRAIDGAEAARFITHLKGLLQEPWSLMV